MSRVNGYRVVFYGNSADKPGLKAKVELYSKAGNTVFSIGKVRFHEGELPEDRDKPGEYLMNLPTSLLGQVIDLLRNEDPIYFAFHEGRAVLGTAIEPAGSGDETSPRAVRIVEAEKTNGFPSKAQTARGHKMAEPVASDEGPAAPAEGDAEAPTEASTEGDAEASTEDEA